MYIQHGFISWDEPDTEVAATSVEWGSVGYQGWQEVQKQQDPARSKQLVSFSVPATSALPPEPASLCKEVFFYTSSFSSLGCETSARLHQYGLD